MTPISSNKTVHKTTGFKNNSPYKQTMPNKTPNNMKYAPLKTEDNQTAKSNDY
jgi:hypothetical protein